MKNPIAKQMRRIKSDLLVPSFAGSRCSKNKTRWTHKSKKDRMKWSQQHITRAWETLKGNTHTLCYRLILDWKELLRSHILLLLSCSYTFRSVSELYIYTSFFLVLCPSQLFPWNHGKIIECVCASVYCQSSEHNIYWKREKNWAHSRAAKFRCNERCLCYTVWGYEGSLSIFGIGKSFVAFHFRTVFISG